MKHHYNSSSYMVLPYLKSTPKQKDSLISPRTEQKSYSIARNTFQTPGPGAYTIALEHSKLGGSILGRSSSTTRHNYPGVGQYSLVQPQTQRCVKFGDMPLRKKRPLPTPGPCSYNKPELPSKGFRIADSKRNWAYLQLRDTPGPGSYSIEPAATKVRQVKSTPRVRKSEQQRFDFVGVEAFKYKQQGKLKTESFPKQIRKNEFLELFAIPLQSPGPAGYMALPKKQTKASKFTQSERIGVFKPKEGPGVGSYNTGPTLGKKFGTKPVKKQLFIDLKKLNLENDY